MLDSVALSLGGIAGVEDKTTAARQSLNQTYDQFLTLLTTQLKNQDPLNPMDSKDFTNQLVALAEVEQSIAQTSKMDELIKLNQTSAINSTMLSYVGMNVDYEGKDFTYKGNVAGGQFQYTLDTNAADTEVNIYDKDDNLVWTGSGQTTKGTHTIEWPGTNSAGQEVGPGYYRFEVKAKDSAGADIASSAPVSQFTYAGNKPEMTLKYKLEGDAAQTKVSVFDLEGNQIWSGAGETTAGDHQIVWPGVDKNGNPVAAGTYRIEVGAQDKEQRAVKTSTTVTATVGGLEVADGQVVLLIGGQKVPINTIKAVRLPS